MNDQQFIQRGTDIAIIFGNEQLTCSIEDFQKIEPEYTKLPSGMIHRVWTPEQSYVSDGVNQYPDDFDGAVFIVRIDDYQTRLSAHQWRYVETHHEDVLLEDNVSLLEDDTL